MTDETDTIALPGGWSLRLDRFHSLAQWAFYDAAGIRITTYCQLRTTAARFATAMNAPAVSPAVADGVAGQPIGWLFHNPDTGLEFSENHPVESGEVTDADNILPATAENLREALFTSWRQIEDYQRHIFSSPVAVPTPPATASAGAAIAVEEVDIGRIWADLRRHGTTDAKNIEAMLHELERRRIAAPQANDGVRELLREVVDQGLIYWDPQTARGAAAKADMMARCDAALKSIATADKPGQFQARVAEWQNRITFDDPTDLAERTHRFSEEANELARALGQTREEAHQIVDYVHDQDHVGDPAAEVGGTELTLAALCVLGGFDMRAAAEAELARVNTPEMVAKIREKRSKRHGRGPLPGTYAPDFIPATDKPGQEGEGLPRTKLQLLALAYQQAQEGDFTLLRRVLIEPAPSPQQDGETEAGR